MAGFPPPLRQFILVILSEHNNLTHRNTGWLLIELNGAEHRWRTCKQEFLAGKHSSTSLTLFTIRFRLLALCGVMLLAIAAMSGVV